MALKRGFKHVEKRIADKGARNFCSCLNCADNKGTNEIECTNTSITEFDMIYSEGREFCTYWRVTVQ